ncbi:MAG: TIGR03936 family radical SAM-associated protein [Rubripirellula sp.]|nr:TIGR03936 family radical SAM-associated protein [Rubripirellula sp.]
MPTVTTSQPTPSESSQEPAEVPVALRIRYRIRFAKSGLLRWISHRDLARLWERLLRRAALRLSMTEGFHPKPRVAFPSALALGVEGANEVVEIELAEMLTPTELLDRLRNDNQPGLTIHSVSLLPEGFGKAQLARGIYEISGPQGGDDAAVGESVQRLIAQETVSVQRKKKNITMNVREHISELKYEAGTLHLSLEATDAASLKPGDVLDLLGLDDWIEQGASIVRTGVILHREFESDDSGVMAVAAGTK